MGEMMEEKLDNYYQSLARYIDSWTQEVISNPDKLNAWIDSTESTKQARKDALLDELFGEEK